MMRNYGTHKAGCLQNLVTKNNNWHLGRPDAHPKLFSVPVASEIHQRIFLPFHSAFMPEVCLAPELVFFFCFFIRCLEALEFPAVLLIFSNMRQSEPQNQKG